MAKEWKKEAIADTVRNGVCDEYQGLMRKCRTEDEMLDLYVRGINWCLEHNSPSIDLLRKYPEECARHGVFIDRDFFGETLIARQSYVFLNCTGTIRTGLNIKERMIPMLYFANGCDMSVRHADGYGTAARVPMMSFGDNRLDGEVSKDIVCVIKQY